MYLFSGIVLLILVVFFIINHHRKKCIIKKICCMCDKDKCCWLNEIVESSGFAYYRNQDIFSAKIDSWQREFGYRALYDQSAPLLNMVFDCEPVYFNYKGKTWLIEFWKGQYGINVGAEIGIYHADTIVPPCQWKEALFMPVSDDEMLPMSMSLYKSGQHILSLKARHWWLAGFDMGSFAYPSSLTLKVAIGFPTQSMLNAFLIGFRQAGYTDYDICDCGVVFSFTFRQPRIPNPHLFQPLGKAFALWRCKMFTALYSWVTRPFCSTFDKMLYLYCFLPFAFRRMLCIRKPNQRKSRKRQRRCY